VPPGNYTVVLKVNGKEYKQSLVIVKDPNTKGTEADIQKQFNFGVKLYNATKTTLQLIGDMERMRAQLLARLKDKKSPALEEKVFQLEAQLHDIYATGARMDIFRNQPQVLERLLAMGKEGQISSADAPPTDQQQEVLAIETDKLAAIQSQFEIIRKSPEIKKIEGK